MRANITHTSIEMLLEIYIHTYVMFIGDAVYIFVQKISYKLKSWYLELHQSTLYTKMTKKALVEIVF